MRWARATGNGPPKERWFARVDLRTFTQGFAQVERIDGQWWLILFPKLSMRQHPELREQRIPYHSPALAKEHLEKWIRATWPGVERRFGIYKPPQSES